MAVSERDLAFVLDQLAALSGLRSTRMFGGVGLYAAGPDGGERFFALMDDGVLYFKADDQTRARYTRRRLKPFQPPGAPPSKNYYTVPAAVLEDGDELLVWAREAIAAAGRSTAAKTRTPAKRAVKKPARKPTRKSGRASD
jgi:DNA transformation protein